VFAQSQPELLVHTTMPILFVEMGLAKVLLTLTLTFNPPSLHLSSSWVYRHVPPCPAPQNINILLCEKKLKPNSV
jgi:hypothetical protein